MWNTVPDLSLALAANPLQMDAEASAISQTEQLLRRFFVLLRDHDLLAPTTLGVLANRWGIERPPETAVIPKVWLYRAERIGSQHDKREDAFERGLAEYLDRVSKQNVSVDSMTSARHG